MGKSNSDTKSERIYKRIYWVVFAILVVSVLPMWYLGRYDVICLDDFGFGSITHHAWIHSHSVKEVFLAACEEVRYMFYEKQATYASIFLMSFFPGVWNEKYYFLVPFIQTSMLIGSVTTFVHVVIKDCLGENDRYLTGISNMLLIFLIIQTLPVPLEAFFWFNGSAHYMFMHSMLLFEISIILHGMHSDKKGAKISCVIAAALIGIVVGGGNLITGLQACILLFLHIIYIICCRINEKKDYKILNTIGIKKGGDLNIIFLIPEVITLIGYLINILAPGNSKRMDEQLQMNPIKAIFLSFYWGISHGVTWVSVMVIIVMLAELVIAIMIVKRSKRDYLHPLFVFILSICVFSAMLTPTFFATSEDAPARVKNIIYLAEIILIFINIFNDVGYVYNSENRHNIIHFWKGLFEYLSAHTSTVIITCVALSILIFVSAEDKNTYTSISAMRSLYNGEAERYYEQSMERSKIYNDVSQKNVVINAITDDAKPYLLFKEDVGNNDGDEGYWQNVLLLDYYEKDSIVVE